MIALQASDDTAWMNADAVQTLVGIAAFQFGCKPYIRRLRRCVAGEWSVTTFDIFQVVIADENTAKGMCGAGDANDTTIEFHRRRADK